jgi:hypothetical protein
VLVMRNANTNIVFERVLSCAFMPLSFDYDKGT